MFIEKGCFGRHAVFFRSSAAKRSSLYKSLICIVCICYDCVASLCMPFNVINCNPAKTKSTSWFLLSSDSSVQCLMQEKWGTCFFFFKKEGRDGGVYLPFTFMQTLTCISKTKLFTWIKKTANPKGKKKRPQQPKETLHTCVNAYRVKGQILIFLKRWFISVTCVFNTNASQCRLCST